MTILYSEPIIEHGIFYTVSQILTISGCMAAIIFMCISMETDSKASKICCGASIVVFVLSLCLLFRMSYYDSFGSGRFRHEVLIEDEYPLEKVYDSYIIKERKGDIWVLEDKEVAEDDATGSN